MPQTANIVYRILDEKDHDQVVACVCEHFIAVEPLAVCVDLRPTEYFPCVIVKNALWQKVSIGAFDVETGALCAVRVNHLEKNEGFLPMVDDEIKHTPNLWKIHRLIEECKKSSPALPHHGENMEHIFVAVDKRYGKRGIATELYRRSEKLARKSGCKNIFAFCSGHYSTLSAIKAGYTKSNAIYYRDYIDKVLGEKVFATVEPPHVCMSLMVKRLV